METKKKNVAGKTIYHEGKLNYKIFSSEYTMVDILNEALNQEKCAEIDTIVPRIQGIQKMDNGIAIVSDYIEAKDIYTYCKDKGIEFTDLLEKFCKLQIKINNSRLVNMKSASVKMIHSIMESDLKGTYKFFFSFMLKDMKPYHNLLHGDFTPSNILINDKGEMAVVDWSHASSGNPLFDVGYTYLSFILEDKKDYAEKYIDTYISLTNTDKDTINKIIPLVSASILYRFKKDKDKYDKLMNIIEESI